MILPEAGVEPSELLLDDELPFPQAASVNKAAPAIIPESNFLFMRFSPIIFYILRKLFCLQYYLNTVGHLQL